jgi:AraC-like DNA-binding protein
MPDEPLPQLGHAAHLLWQRLTLVERVDRRRSLESWLGDHHQRVGDDRLRLDLLEAGHAVALACHRDEETNDCRCHVVAWSMVTALASPEGDPRAIFLRWAHAWLAQADRDHPELPAERAAALIRSRPDQRWTPGALATRVGEPRRQLTISFTGIFGVSPSEYVHLVRIERAVRLAGEASKIEALAREVGYRSKKDFYAATERWLGVTPARLRAWTPNARETLARRLQAIARRGLGDDTLVATRVRGYRYARTGAQTQRRRWRLALTISTASVPATSAAPPTSATPA